MKKYGRDRLKKVYEDIGLPKTTKFKGYVLHLPDSDEFMAVADYGSDNQHTINYAWIGSPDGALVFKKHIKAVRELQEYNKNNIELCLLFDIGQQLIVVQEAAVLDFLGLLN